MTALMTFLIAASSTREASQPHKETTYPPPRNHRGDLHRPGAVRPCRTLRHPVAASAAGTPAARVFAPARRDHHVLPPASQVGPDTHRPAGGAPRPHLGCCDPQRARRDPGADQAETTVADPRMVPHGRPLRPQRRITGLAHLESAVRERPAVHPAELDRRRRNRGDMAVGIAAGAAVPRLPALADPRLGCVAEHVARVRAAVTP